MAKQLARAGYFVTIMGRNPDKLKIALQELKFFLFHLR